MALCASRPFRGTPKAVGSAASRDGGSGIKMEVARDRRTHPLSMRYTKIQAAKLISRRRDLPAKGTGYCRGRVLTGCSNALPPSTGDRGPLRPGLATPPCEARRNAVCWRSCS